jgi:hypothetical protein
MMKIGSKGIAMAKEPDPESVARAARLREQIDKMTKSDSNQDPIEKTLPQGRGETPPLSPREFIHKRMQELDKGKKE